MYAMEDKDETMGHTTVKVGIFNKKKSREVELLVDTGSAYSWVSRAVLKELGIKPTNRRKFKTIEGKRIEREIAEAVFEYEGERATTIVVFAEERDASVFGLHALEGLALEVDPLARTVRKAEALLAV